MLLSLNLRGSETPGSAAGDRHSMLSAVSVWPWVRMRGEVWGAGVGQDVRVHNHDGVRSGEGTRVG